MSNGKEKRSGANEDDEAPRVAYVIGPYRADTVRGIVRNIMNAEAVTCGLLREGFAVICPHKNTGLLDGVLPDGEFLRRSMALLQRCDFAVALPGWEGSEGSIAEVHHCASRSIPVHFIEDPRRDVAHANQ